MRMRELRSAVWDPGICAGECGRAVSGRLFPGTHTQSVSDQSLRPVAPCALLYLITHRVHTVVVFYSVGRTHSHRDHPCLRLRSPASYYTGYTRKHRACRRSRTTGRSVPNTQEHPVVLTEHPTYPPMEPPRAPPRAPAGPFSFQGNPFQALMPG